MPEVEEIDEYPQAARLTETAEFFTGEMPPHPLRFNVKLGKLQQGVVMHSNLGNRKVHWATVPDYEGDDEGGADAAV